MAMSNPPPPTGVSQFHRSRISAAVKEKAEEWYRDNIRDRTLPAAGLGINCTLADLEYVRDHMRFLLSATKIFLNRPLANILWLIHEDRGGLALANVRNFLLDTRDWLRRLTIPIRNCNKTGRYGNLANLINYDPLSKRYLYGAAKQFYIVGELIGDGRKIVLYGTAPPFQINFHYEDLISEISTMLRFIGHCMIKAVKHNEYYYSVIENLGQRADRCLWLMRGNGQMTELPRYTSPMVTFRPEIDAPYYRITHIDPHGSTFLSYVQGLQDLLKEFQRFEHILVQSWFAEAYITAKLSLLDLANRVYDLWDSRLRVAINQVFGVGLHYQYTNVERVYNIDRASRDEKVARGFMVKTLLDSIRYSLLKYNEDLVNLIQPRQSHTLHYEHPISSEALNARMELRGYFEKLFELSNYCYSMVTTPTNMKSSMLPALLNSMIVSLSNHLNQSCAGTKATIQLNSENGNVRSDNDAINAYLDD